MRLPSRVDPVKTIERTADVSRNLDGSGALSEHTRFRQRLVSKWYHRIIKLTLYLIVAASYHPSFAPTNLYFV